jgi:putative transposase
VTRNRRKGEPSALKEDPRVQPSTKPKGQVWDCPLLTAGTSDGAPFEIMPIVDERSKECLATLVERNISAQDVTDRLFELFILRGAPECIRSNNGAGSMAKAIDDWLRQSGVETHSVKGKPRKKSGAGPFSGKLKDELIDKTTFSTLSEAKAAIEGWRELHNKTLLPQPAPTGGPSQHPRLQHSTGDDSAEGQTPRLGRSLSDKGLGGQSAPHSDSPGAQLELNEAPGLPGSIRRGAEVRPFVSSLGSPPDGADDGQSVQPQGSVRELAGAHGTGRPSRVVSAKDESVLLEPTRDEASTCRIHPHQPSLEDEFDASGAMAGLGPLEGGASLSVQSQDTLEVIEADQSDQSIQSDGSVRELAGAHGTGRPSRVVSAKEESVAPSLKPVFFPRHPMRTAIGKVKKTLVRSMEWVVVAAPIPLATLVLLILVAPYFGWRVDAVRSGSVEPGLKVGSIVVTRPVQAEEISVGDVVTFRSPTSGEITSRRVSAIEDGPSFRTEGIADGNADAFITPAQGVVGKVCFHVPFAGYIVQYLMTPMCLLLLFVFGFSIVVAGMASSMLQLRRRPPA